MPDLYRDVVSDKMVAALQSRTAFLGEGQAREYPSVQRTPSTRNRVRTSPPHNHLLFVHLNGPVLVEEKYSGRRTERRWAEDGKISLSPAGLPVTRYIKGNPEVILVRISCGLLTEVSENVYGLEQSPVSVLPRLAVPDQRLSRLGRLLQAEIGTGNPGNGLMVDALGRVVALHILRHHSTIASRQPENPASAPNWRLRHVIDHMRTHMGETLSLEQLAGLSGLSCSQFARAFRDATGHPPHQYLIRLRVEAARELLEQTLLSVKEVGAQCGFEQPNHFATMFRKVTGMGPRSWRLARRP